TDPRILPGQGPVVTGRPALRAAGKSSARKGNRRAPCRARCRSGPGPARPGPFPDVNQPGQRPGSTKDSSPSSLRCRGRSGGPRFLDERGAGDATQHDGALLALLDLLKEDANLLVIGHRNLP